MRESGKCLPRRQGRISRGNPRRADECVRHLIRKCLLIRPFAHYDGSMDVTLTPKMEVMIRHHMALGLGRSPEGVLARALYRLQEVEMMEPQNSSAIKSEREKPIEFADPCGLPLLKQLHETPGPRLGLKELRRRLAKKISGTMAQTVREDRNDRV